LAILVVFIYLQACSLKITWDSLASPSPPRNVETSFKHLAKHCAQVPPISADEFHSRQVALARTLHELGAVAYIAEPGANAEFFGNISSSQWHLSERPLLLIISPNELDGNVVPRISILTPTFEATRAKLLPVSSQDVSYFDWPEDSNPYDIAISSLSSNLKSGTIFVDSSIRKFISDGLADAYTGGDILSAPLEVRSLRERKSAAEIKLLRCANEVTLMAIRAAREHFYIGMRESAAQGLVVKALADAGLKSGFALTLFGENAALPHGSGTDRELGESDFILIDTGGSLHGYESDITRTFALKDSIIPTGHLELWNIVRSAQLAAHHTARNGTLTRRVDEAARAVITEAGYGRYFTHRLGHGIGLEGHEAPYLRGGSDDVIRPGHSFSNEPGVYIEGKVGVRLEDIFYISEDGVAVFLTDGVGGLATSPWKI